MSKMIMLECSAPHWIQVAKNLESQGTKVAYWTAWIYLLDEIQANFPGCTVQNTIDAKRGLAPDGKEPTGTSFDSACEKVWREDAQVVYDLMTRFDNTHDFTLTDRAILFYKMLVYWRQVLAEIQPALVVFPAPPHVIYDYIVLCLCRTLGIKTIMFEEATVYPPYSLVMSDYRTGVDTISRELQNVLLDTSLISDETRKLAWNLRGCYSDAKPYREVTAQATMAKALSAGMEALNDRLKKVEAKDAKHKGLNNNENPKHINVSSLYKERGVSLGASYEGPYSNTRFAKQRIEDRIRTDKLRAFYNARTTPIGHIAQPFIYVPLAGQPERTSNPQADIFCNQILMLNIIANSLPEGWQVVVKEHPNQFHPDFSVNMYRSEDYYMAILAIPKVRLVSTEADPFWLIDNSAATATTGGTTALEGVARGKRCALFGDAWYRGCPGVHRVRGLEDMRDFVSRISAPMNPIAFEAFLEAVARTSFKGMADYPPDGWVMDEALNIENLTTLVQAALNPIIKDQK